MKTATLPSLRVAPELRQAAEADRSSRVPTSLTSKALREGRVLHG